MTSKLSDDMNNEEYSIGKYSVIPSILLILTGIILGVCLATSIEVTESNKKLDSLIVLEHRKPIMYVPIDTDKTITK